MYMCNYPTMTPPTVTTAYVHIQLLPHRPRPTNRIKHAAIENNLRSTRPPNRSSSSARVVRHHFQHTSSLRLDHNVYLSVTPPQVYQRYSEKEYSPRKIHTVWKQHTAAAAFIVTRVYKVTAAEDRPFLALETEGSINPANMQYKPQC
jgi:hypothetical protein